VVRKEPVDVLCVCGQLSGKQHPMSYFAQGSAATLFGWGGRYCCTPKIIKICSYFAELFKYKGEEAFFKTVYSERLQKWYSVFGLVWRAGFGSVPSGWQTSAGVRSHLNYRH